jgi:hypothetical protein
VAEALRFVEWEVERAADDYCVHGCIRN